MQHSYIKAGGTKVKKNKRQTSLIIDKNTFPMGKELKETGSWLQISAGYSINIKFLMCSSYSYRKRHLGKQSADIIHLSQFHENTV